MGQAQKAGSHIGKSDQEKAPTHPEFRRQVAYEPVELQNRMCLQCHEQEDNTIAWRGSAHEAGEAAVCSIVTRSIRRMIPRSTR